MKILRAIHLGLCFGVRDAIDLAFAQGAQEPLTILGDLVHNETVLARLRAQGIQSAPQPEAVRTASAMITAHGASEKAKQRARSLGLHLIEATCPLVHRAHEAVTHLVRSGYHPVIVGQRQHVEVRGLVEDLQDFDVVLSPEDVHQLKEKPRFGVAAQTTQPIARVRELVALIRLRFPRSEVRFIDTVCQPTKQRQTAAIEVAQASDVVVVVGGKHSNNTRELVATCREHCPQVYPVQSADELQADWFWAAQTVGLTAGTSTPDEVIDAVEQWLHHLATPQTQYELAHATG